jgi:hypothetical protein
MPALKRAPKGPGKTKIGNGLRLKVFFQYRQLIRIQAESHEWQRIFPLEQSKAGS